MTFGLSGSHRSGKTTLAKEVAKVTGIHYLDASTTAIMEGTGFNPVGTDHSVEKRLVAQEFLLKEFTKMAMKAPYPFISDRTPIDYAAYMLGEVTMHNTSAEVGARVDTYVKDCLTITARLFSCVMAVRPIGISYEVRSDKPPENLGYQRLIQTLVEGTLSCIEEVGDGRTNAVTILVKDLDDRVGYAIECINATQKQQQRLRERVRFH
jgi:hypothetical protein